MMYKHALLVQHHYYRYRILKAQYVRQFSQASLSRTNIYRCASIHSKLKVIRVPLKQLLNKHDLR
jgi:hypothetical protein